MTDLWTIGLAAGLGWYLARAALCAVAATQEAIQAQRSTGLTLQVIALGTTAVVLLGLSLWIGDVGRLPGDGGTRLTVALAACVMALGAMLNGGCYLGSIMYLGRGKANFLFSLLGIALAVRVDLPGAWGIASHPSLRPQPGNTLLGVATLGFAVLVLLAVRALRRTHGVSLDARMGATLFAGVLAGTLMLHAPGWGYAAVLNAVGRWGIAPFDVTLVAPAAALFLGAVASCIAAGTWAPAAPTWLGAVRCLTGGFVMESAAHCIPGGNDVLLLWVLPGLGGYGLLAYSLLLSTMLLIWRLFGRRAQNV